MQRVRAGARGCDALRRDAPEETADGRLTVLLVNTGGEPQAFDFRMEPQRWLKSRSPFRLSSLTPGGETPVGLAKDQRVCLGDLQPREIRVFILTPQ